MNIRLNTDTRVDLLNYAFGDIDLKWDTKEDKNKQLDYVIAKNIIESSHCSLNYRKFTMECIEDNDFHRLIHSVIDTISIDSEHYTNVKDRIDWLLHSNKVGTKYNEEDIVTLIAHDKKTLELCKLYNQYVKAVRNRKAHNIDNNIAQDWFIFEMTMRRVAEEIVGTNNIRYVISNRDGIGQAMTADAILKNKGKYLIIDTKFYRSSIIKQEDNNAIYKHQSNRNQMSTYISTLSDNKNIEVTNIRGIIMHGITENSFNKIKDFNGKGMNAGKNKINLELVVVDTSAENIINQIKSIILYYIKEPMY